MGILDVVLVLFTTQNHGFSRFVYMYTHVQALQSLPFKAATCATPNLSVKIKCFYKNFKELLKHPRKTYFCKLHQASKIHNLHEVWRF